MFYYEDSNSAKDPHMLYHQNLQAILERVCTLGLDLSKFEFITLKSNQIN